MKIRAYFLKECCTPVDRYGINSPAYAFPFEEDPRKIKEYKERLNLERVLTIASGGGIPLLIFLELGAKRVDVVDISKNSLALAALRLGAAMDGIHNMFSRSLYFNSLQFVPLANRIALFHPEIKYMLSKLDVNIASLSTSSIKPVDGSFLEDFTEYEIQEAEVNFILSDISSLNPETHTTIFLSNVLSYNFSNMMGFIQNVSDASTVIYTIAGAPKIFVLSGKEFKDKFLPLYNL